MGDDNWKNSKVVEENGDLPLERVLGLKMAAKDKARKAFDEFIQDIEKRTKKVFKKIRYMDKWTVQSQIFVMSLICIPPIFFSVFWIVSMLYCKFCNHLIDKKYENLNKEMKKTKAA